MAVAPSPGEDFQSSFHRDTILIKVEEKTRKILFQSSFHRAVETSQWAAI